MRIRSAMTGVGVILFLGGLAAGPGYYFYCTQFSGTQVGKFTLTRSSRALPPGLGQAKGPRRPYAPLALQLDPGMNPVGFVWQGTWSGVVIDRKDNDYRALLYLADREIMQERFSVSYTKESSGTHARWISVGAIDVPSAATYRFVLEEAAPPQLSFSSMQIEVRRNVVRPRMAVALGGGAAALAGFLLTLSMLWLTHRADDRALQQAMPEAFHPGLNAIDRQFKVRIVFVLAFISLMAFLMFYDK